MNRFINGVIALCAAIIIVSCQDTKEDANQPQSQKDIYRTIGEEIPFETALQWMDYHHKRSGAARLDSLAACKVPSSSMNHLLSSVDNLVGVAFHYAIDDFGTPHILVIPVNETMELWSSIPGRVIIDGNTGAEISHELAAAWAANYEAAYPSEVWYHFFGKEIFDQMQALPYFESVDIEPATNPEDQSAQLLLIVWNDTQTSTGRTTATQATVYDASNACPPCATR